MQGLDVSVVVPVAPGEEEWQQLCSYLALLPENCEVIFVRPTKLTRQEKSMLSLLERKIEVKWLTTRKGRAVQMNHGAKAASKNFLWFLHADTHFSPDVLNVLARSLRSTPGALHYFNLAYRSDGPLLSKLNAWGAWARSHTLHLPFGDQGLCLARSLFFQLGAYDERASYGEDHLLIWQALKRKVPVLCTGATLHTSARKYQTHGWLKTTLRHGLLTWKQAIPQWLEIQQQNWKGRA